MAVQRDRRRSAPKIRVDVSDKLIHFTRNVHRSMTAQQRFIRIVSERKLRGSSGLGPKARIKGGHKVICFTEAPLSGLAPVLTKLAGTVKYCPLGIMVSKEWLFAQGGRPVIYQPDSEYSQLGASKKFLHMRYDPPKFDFTWEREWRIKTEVLDLDPMATTLVVPSRAWVDRMKAESFGMAIVSGGLLGILDWNCIVLEDLGISFERHPDYEPTRTALLPDAAIGEATSGGAAGPHSAAPGPTDR